MPTYAYACTSCGHRFDAVQSFSDAALTECPECGGPATPLHIVMWGHCRPCHTADSRSIQPLRW